MPDRVLLINPPTEGKYFLTKQPPLGLLYIASYLRSCGIYVRMLDLNVCPGWRSKLKEAIKGYEPQIAGISSNFSNTGQSAEIAFLIKSLNKDITVVAGGPQPTVAPEEYQVPDIDYIIPYESEKVMLDFCRSGAKGAVPGVLSCRDQDIRRSYGAITRELVEDLDSLPFPAYDMLDVSRYYTLGYKKLPLVSMVTSRGCGHKCVFCSQAVSGEKWRKRSAENVVDEMEWLIKSIGAGEISVEDDNFTSEPERVRRICALIRRRNLSFSWQLQNGIRVDGLNKDLLQDLKNAGCWKVAIAPEVGDEESLRKIGKGATLEQFRKAAALCRDVGMVYLGYFMMGFPFQTDEDMDRTSVFAKELDPLCISLTKLVPFPGTPLFRRYPSTVHLKRRSYFYRGDDLSVERKYAKAYFEFYARPKKLVEICSKLGFRQFWRLILNACDIFLFRRG